MPVVRSKGLKDEKGQEKNRNSNKQSNIEKYTDNYNDKDRDKGRERGRKQGRETEREKEVVSGMTLHDQTMSVQAARACVMLSAKELVTSLGAAADNSKRGAGRADVTPSGMEHTMSSISVIVTSRHYCNCYCCHYNCHMCVCVCVLI